MADPQEEGEDVPPGLSQPLFESKYHWMCRRKFIEDHKAIHGLKRAICLSFVWANYSFMGCKYSDKLMESILYYPVPEENEIERWIKVHPDIDCERNRVGVKRTSSARDTPITVPTLDTATPTSVIEESSPLKKAKKEEDVMSYDHLTNELDKFISLIRQKNSNQSNNNHTHVDHTHIRLEIIRLLADECWCDQCYHGNHHPVSLLEHLTSRHKLELKYDWMENEDGTYTISMYINGHLMLSLAGQVKKQMKNELSQMFVDQVIYYQSQLNVKPVCPASQEKLVDKNELMDRSSLLSHECEIKKNNKGHQMLLKMGWKGEGGLVNGGINCPIDHQYQDGRMGLGGQPSLLSRNEISSTFKRFMEDDNQTRLRFPSDLTSDERSMIHKMASQNHLVHKSYGNKESRTLIITKKKPETDTSGIGMGPYKQ